MFKARRLMFLLMMMKIFPEVMCDDTMVRNSNFKEEDVGLPSSFVCRSKETFLVWPLSSSTLLAFEYTSQSVQRELKSCSSVSESYDDAYKSAWNYLRQNVMGFDTGKLETLGLGEYQDSNEDNLDGLQTGIVSPTIELALRSKVQYEWTDALPQSIFYE
jgi:hypothetical protein